MHILFSIIAGRFFSLLPKEHSLQINCKFANCIAVMTSFDCVVLSRRFFFRHMQTQVNIKNAYLKIEISSNHIAAHVDVIRNNEIQCFFFCYYYCCCCFCCSCDNCCNHERFVLLCVFQVWLSIASAHSIESFEFRTMKIVH